MVLFRHHNKKINYDLKIKLNGKCLHYISHVKYLGKILDEHFSWTDQLKFLASKLRSANRALSKIRYYLPREILNTFIMHFNITYFLCNTDMGTVSFE